MKLLDRLKSVAMLSAQSFMGDDTAQLDVHFQKNLQVTSTRRDVKVVNRDWSTQFIISANFCCSVSMSSLSKNTCSI